MVWCAALWLYEYCTTLYCTVLYDSGNGTLFLLNFLFIFCFWNEDF